MDIKPTFEIALYQAEIPPNTGNIIRLCANTGSRLHIIKPIGFDFNEKSLRRAGLDYAKKVEIVQYEDFQDFYRSNNLKNIYVITKYGNISYEKINYKLGDFYSLALNQKVLETKFLKLLSKTLRYLSP